MRALTPHPSLIHCFLLFCSLSTLIGCGSGNRTSEAAASTSSSSPLESITISGLKGSAVPCSTDIQFTARTASGGFAPSWSVVGAGSISASGLYSAPACSTSLSVSVSATDPSTNTTASLTFAIAPPSDTPREVITILLPAGNTVACGQTMALTATSNLKSIFVPTWSLIGAGSIGPDGTYTAPACPSQAAISVVVSDTATSISAMTVLQVVSPAPTTSEVITIGGLNGSTATLACGQSVALRAQSNLSSAFAAVWGVQGGGSITSDGVLSAPACPSQTVVTVSALDPATSSSARLPVQIMSPPTSDPEVIVITGMTGPSLSCGQLVQLTAKSSNAGAFSPAWSVHGGGAVTVSGLYTAPACPFEGSVIITAADLPTGTSARLTLPIVTPAPEVITISSGGPSTLSCGQSISLTAQSSTSANLNPNWSVQGAGSISPDGIYTAPTCPTQSTVTIVATSASTSSSGRLSITITEPTPTLTAVSPSTFTPNIYIDAVVTGEGFDSSSVVALNGIAQPTALLSHSKLSVRIAPLPAGLAIGSLSILNMSGQASQTLQVPINVTYDAAARFLQQASWGATPATIAHVQTVGMDGYLKEQFASTEDSYTDANFQHVAENFWWAATLHEQSQLRTKLGWAWYKLFNSPGTTVTGMLSSIPNITNRDAFAPYATLLGDVSTNIEMGLYFNYCCFDSAEAISGNHPDENFGRELMQQFTIGPYLLNGDGTYQLDRLGNPVPASSQNDVISLARSMTGLSYSLDAFAGGDPEGLVPMNSGDAVDHDGGSKLLLGEAIPSGMDALTEVQFVTKRLAANPNTGIHLSKFLIHELVTSNPSASYVTRIARVWSDDGTGQRGNTQAVIRAILLDAEARAGDDPTVSVEPSSGRFRDSVNYETSLLRQFGAVPRPGIPLVGIANTTATLSHEGIFSAPSVFGYYSDFNSITGGLLAPEAQIYTSDALVQRANFAAYIFGLPGGPNPGLQSVDWTPWEPLAHGDGASLLTAWNHLCFHGRMSSELFAVLQSNLQSIPDTDPLTRVEQTAYLIVMSPEYMVEN